MISSRQHGLMLAGVFALLGAVHANPAQVKFCKDSAGKDCPAGVTSEGIGYPNCVIYNSSAVFGPYDYPAGDNGGYAPFIDISQPDYGCAIILTTPANVDLENCGVPIGSWKNAIIAKVQIQDTFMVQFCCGTGDCTAAGAEKRSLGDSLNENPRRTVITVDGQIIPPMEVGYPPAFTADKRTISAKPISKRAGLMCGTSSKRSVSALRGSNNVQKRDGKCDNNFKVTKAPYTTESPCPKEYVSSQVGPGGSVQITQTRTSEWSYSTTTGVSAGLSFDDVLSLGVEASTTMEWSESISDSTAYTFQVPDGESGTVVFTPFIMCVEGSGTCGGDAVDGTFCTPYKQGGAIAGEYSLVQHG